MMDIHSIRLANLKQIIDSRFRGKAADLVEALNKSAAEKPIASSSVYRYFTKGKHARHVGSKFARRVEEALGIEYGWIDTLHNKVTAVGEQGTPYNTSGEALKKQTKIPHLSYVQAGSWCEAIDIYEPGFADNWIESIDQYSKNCFAVSVEGDSMTAPLGVTPSFPAATIIHINPSRSAEVGSFVVAKRVSDGHVTFKQLRYSEGQPYLYALNPTVPAIYDEFDIIGVVYDARPPQSWFI